MEVNKTDINGYSTAYTLRIRLDMVTAQMGKCLLSSLKHEIMRFFFFNSSSPILLKLIKYTI